MKRLRLGGAGFAVIGLILCGMARQSSAQQEQVASVEQLKTEAFKEIRDGHFDRSNQLLAEAASMTSDPLVKQMAAWTGHFESQAQEFATERHAQFTKRVEQTKLLQAHNMPDYALDAAANAYLLADDKNAFRAEKWVDDLVNSEIQRASQDDENEQWIASLRIYSDLGSLDPAVPTWKDKLKLATRRVRLLALYTPDVFKQLQSADSKEREEVDRLLNPTTQPATQPAAEADSDSFKVDWHENLRGIHPDMLWDALVYARNNYYREVDYKTLALGGINGLRAVVTTKGLEQAFPKLADANARNTFLATLDECTAANKAATGIGEQAAISNTLQRLESVDQQTVELPEPVLISEFADGAFGELDPFSTIFWPNDLEEFNRTTQGEFSGVGIQIQTAPDGSLQVVSPLEDTPAYKAGVKAGDIITRIDGKNAKGISLNQAVRSITGPVGTTVVLTIRTTDGKVRDMPIQRDTIKVASVKGWVHKPGGGWTYMVDPQQKIAYVRITNFTRDTSNELNKAVDQIKQDGAKAMILDLRHNPGGLLTAATEVSDKFLRDGVIVSTRPDRETGSQPTVAVAKPDPDDCDLPLVVLVNQYSASASEIVSGALKDQKRALLVGERTFGKGSVQMLFPIGDHSACLKLTTSHYYLPSGRCIHREENSTEWGVDPDVTIEMTPEQMRAAIDARQQFDVLHDPDDAAAHQTAVAPTTPTTLPTTGPVATTNKDLLSSDPQLSAALLLLRLKINGAAI
jgi:carboxyl-terminal processing protease